MTVLHHNKPQPLNTCPLCGSISSTVMYHDVPDFKYRVPGKWDFLRCHDCGLIFLHTIPCKIDIIQPRDYSKHKPPRVPEIKGEGIMAGIKGWIRYGIMWQHGYKLAQNPLQKIAGRLLSLFPKIVLKSAWGILLFPKAHYGKTILDVGCGNGRFLAIMKKLGWNVYGVEPDPISLKISREIIGNKIHQSLDDMMALDVQFDVITMNHVLEHIDKPLAILKKCGQMLKPDGCIGICVPNWLSCTHRLFKKYWHALEPPRHVTMYEPDTLRILIQRSGFTVTMLETTSIRDGIVPFKKSYKNRYGRAPSFILMLMWNIFLMLTCFTDKKRGEEILLWGIKSVS